MSNFLALRRIFLFGALGLATAAVQACTDRSFDDPVGPVEVPSFDLQAAQDVGQAIAAQNRYTPALMRSSGVRGTAVGFLPDGRLGIRVFVERADVPVPATLDGIPVGAEVSGPVMAFGDPKTKKRPASLGYSVGHFDITAGSIGARVLDGSGNVLVLSNNHVLANTNSATIGDAVLQPGPYDGGTLADQFATLAAFKPIDFSGGANTIDAALALSDPSDLDNSTDADAGYYGTPNSAIYGDANGDGVFDDPNSLLGLDVQKVGRTTLLTRGTITGVNATFNVCYEAISTPWGALCVSAALFVDQFVIEPGAFSAGGDSGSLIVTDDADARPVALLFAGSPDVTLANRIDLVLDHFGVTIDGVGSEPPPAPEPLTDIEVASVSAPSTAVGGDVVGVTVTVRNAGNQDVDGAFAVSLEDMTPSTPVLVESQSVDGLPAGASTDLSFSWDTQGATFEDHVLVAEQHFADDEPANDQSSTTVTLTDPAAPSGMHVGDLDASTSNGGSTWSATVEVAVHDATDGLLNGATVVGTWSHPGLASDTCTTGELGGEGTCIFLFPSLRKNVRSVTFTVTSVTKAGETYEAGLNHDGDGDSDGTSITVER